ncbi:cutinase-domain-containing protein [Aureobasidium sp. EXF-8845]|nr:cutinase-domain-containing protein [Aureobasidium sp. EXF-8845]KAI4858097.1 cutinase-domain-containing protein [Aureobasidium sp. EXF-8846]
MKSFFITCLAATGAFAAPLAAPQFGGFPSFGGGLGSSTKNDVISGVCKPVTYIFARGTTEIGNMGSTVGPALQKALESAFGQNNVATQGVTYPADVAGAISGALSPGTAQGARTMASLAQQVLSKCPDTKVVLAGYSQGAEQVHGALINLQNGQVAAAITFGDPLQRSPFRNIDSGRTKIYCNLLDAVCNGAFIISASHLSYSIQDATPAAQFAKGVIGNI